VTKLVEKVIVGWQRDWGKWPDTENRDYSDVMAMRADRCYAVGSEAVTVRVRWYPVHRAYVAAGVQALPTPHPYVDNTKPPAKSVLDAMIGDLAAIARECRICYWEHAHQCYPAVASSLGRLFRHSILLHGDDCPGSTEIKTMPIACYFDSVFHGNVIWRSDGDRTRDLYRRFGVRDTHYVSAFTSAGLERGIRDLGWCRPDGTFDLDRRIDQLRAGGYDCDLAFVGAKMGGQRMLLDGYADLLRGVGLRVRFHGVGMRHGPLQPYPPIGIHPLGLAWPLADLYMRSFSTVNCPFIGLMGTRPFDAWMSGVLLVSADPVGEMSSLGIQPGIHYAAYDGTLAGLASTVLHYKGHVDETERIVRAGYEFGRKFFAQHSVDRAMERVLAANVHKWGW